MPACNTPVPINKRWGERLGPAKDWILSTTHWISEDASDLTYLHVCSELCNVLQVTFIKSQEFRSFNSHSSTFLFYFKIFTLPNWTRERCQGDCHFQNVHKRPSWAPQVFVHCQLPGPRGSVLGDCSSQGAACEALCPGLWLSVPEISVLSRPSGCLRGRGVKRRYSSFWSSFSREKTDIG